ncbi:MAG: type III ribulose-bisphosphate carboxylase [Euryarchaeota archaeon]|nr:type III ribulose-bisphosphate carboxylase [Euryarchaeota archaeon]
MPAKDWYHEFIDTGYRPARDDIVVHFRFDAGRSISAAEAVGRIASESSVGTWTTLSRLPPRLGVLKARAFDFDDTRALVAYPRGLWEPGNLPQLLSGIAGNIFGMKAVKNLRLLDVTLPAWYLRDFHGPQFGIRGLRRVLKNKDRPITATVPKPKLGYSAVEHAAIGRELWLGGVDLIKDDENLTDQSFNRFQKRVELLTKAKARAERETGDVKSALINVTAETNEMIRRARVLSRLGWEYAMVDVVTVGPAALMTLRDECERLGLALHAHRAMHAMFTKNLRHGMTMAALAKFMRLVGVDQLHTGTIIGKLESPREEVEAAVATLREKRVRPKGFLLAQDWAGVRPAFPVASGGLHPGLVPEIMKTFGPDVVIQVGGGVLGHPQGARAGAMALRQAIDAGLDGESLASASKRNRELASAMEKWGHLRPR